MDPLSLAASISGLISLAQTLIPLFVGYVDNVRGYPAEFAGLLNEVNGLYGVLCMIQPIVVEIESRSPPGQQAVLPVSREQLEECRDALKAVETLLQKYKPSNSRIVGKSLKALVWALKTAKRDSVIKRLERQKGILQLALLGTSMHSSVQAANEAREDRDVRQMEVEETRKQLDLAQKADEESRHERLLRKRQALLKWLSPQSSSAEHEGLQAKRVENTGQWFLSDENFQTWAFGSGIQLLLCPGIAGSGKTVLMSTVVDHLRHIPNKTKSAVIYIYFDYQDRFNQTAVRVLRSFLKQLTSQQDDISPSMSNLYEECTSRDITPELHVFLQEFKSCCAEFDSVYVLMDAFDECDALQQGPILSLVREILLQPSVKVMITTRPYLQNLNTLSESALDLEIKACDGDVRVFLASRLKGVQYISEDLKSRAIDVIAQGAEGMFLLAELQLEFLLNEKEPRMVEALVHRPNALPRNIETAYKGLFERVSRDHSHKLVFKILSWIFHAKEPLLMDELQEALAVEIGDEQVCTNYFLKPAVIVEVCKSLIVHEKKSGIVRLTHSTVRDFLEHMREEGLFSKGELVKTLLTYLLFPVFQKPCIDDAELESRITDYPLGRYAAKWWPEYVKGDGEKDPVVQRLLFDLFQSPQHVESMLQIAEKRIQIPLGATLLHFSAFYGFNFTAALLLHQVMPNDPSQGSLPRISTQHFGHVNDYDGNGETPLHVAAKRGHQAIVQMLLKGGASINVPTQDSLCVTALHLAVIGGHVGVVDVLLNNNAEVDCRGHYLGETPLLLAAMFGRSEPMNLLLKAHADAAATTEVSRRTALMWAVNVPNALELVSILLKAGVDVNARDADGRTALHYALDLFSFTTAKQLLEVLLKAGAEINIHCTAKGNTPLHTVACIDLQSRQFERDLEIMKARFWTPSVNEIYAHRCAIKATPMPRCDEVEGEHELGEIVKLLLRHHADVNARNFDGNTASQCAVKHHNLLPALILMQASNESLSFTMDTLGEQDMLDALTSVVEMNIRDEGP